MRRNQNQASWFEGWMQGSKTTGRIFKMFDDIPNSYDVEFLFRKHDLFTGTGPDFGSSFLPSVF